MEFRLPDAWARQTIRSQSCSYGFLVANRIMIFTIGLPVLYAPGTRALSCCWRLDKKDNVSHPVPPIIVEPTLLYLGR